MAREIQGQRLRYFPRDNQRSDPIPAFGEHLQNRIVHIIVDEDDPLLCRTDQVRHEGVGIENLPVVEDTLRRRQRGADKETDLFLVFGDPLLQPFYPLVDGISA